MGSGGHARSGPPKTEGSRTSDRAGFSLTALPAAGYDGEVPDFPLPALRVYRWEYEDKRKFQVLDDEETAAGAERETELWALLWSYPQALWWSTVPWKWNQIAMYVRTWVICEGPNATAADKNSMHRFADEIGLTEGGMARAGLKIADAPKADADAAAAVPANVTDIKKRLSRGKT